MTTLANDQIQALALACGFELKPQPDGSQALHPYVFDFARRLLAAGQALPVIDWQPIEKAPRAPLPDQDEEYPHLNCGERVLVFCPPSGNLLQDAGRVHVAWHDWFGDQDLYPDGVWLYSDAGGLMSACHPTHWARVAPPTAAPSATPTAE